MAGPSLNKFYEKCIKEYGVIVDDDISDEIYFQIALYEITIRVHSNNFQTLGREDTFEIIISNLGTYFNLSELDVLRFK